MLWWGCVAQVEGGVDELIDVGGEALEGEAGVGTAAPVRRAVHVRHAQAHQLVLLCEHMFFIHTIYVGVANEHRNQIETKLYTTMLWQYSSKYKVGVAEHRSV